MIITDIHVVEVHYMSVDLNLFQTFLPFKLNLSLTTIAMTLELLVSKPPQRNDRPTIPSSPFFFKVTSIHGQTAETTNHALRCRVLSGLGSGGLHDGTRHSCHSPHSAKRHWLLGHRVSVPVDPEGLCARGPGRGPAEPGPADSSLALLSQQEDISWSNSEAVDGGCPVSGENGVGED